MEFHEYHVPGVANLYCLHERPTEFLKLWYILHKQHIEIIGKSTKTMHKITSVQKIEPSIGNQSVIWPQNTCTFNLYWARNRTGNQQSKPRSGAGKSTKYTWIMDTINSKKSTDKSAAKKVWKLTRQNYSRTPTKATKMYRPKSIFYMYNAQIYS